MQKSNLIIVTSTLVALSSLISTSARADDFINGSFESPVIHQATIVQVSGGEVDGWTFSGNSIGYLISNGFDGAGTGVSWYSTPAGNQYLYLHQGVSDTSTISQSVNVAAGSNTVSFLLADFASPFSLAGGEVNLQILNPDGTTLVAPTLFSTPDYSDFISESLQFTAPTTGSYEFDFISVGGHAANIDNVQLNAVPEPGSLALVGLGGLALLRRRRSA